MVDQRGGTILLNAPGSLLFGLNDGGGDEYGRFFLDEVRIYDHALGENAIRNDMAQIAEPSTYALLGMAAVGMFGYGWRRKRKA